MISWPTTGAPAISTSPARERSISMTGATTRRRPRDRTSTAMARRQRQRASRPDRDPADRHPDIGPGAEPGKRDCQRTDRPATRGTAAAEQPTAVRRVQGRRGSSLGPDSDPFQQGNERPVRNRQGERQVRDALVRVLRRHRGLPAPRCRTRKPLSTPTAPQRWLLPDRPDVTGHHANRRRSARPRRPRPATT